MKSTSVLLMALLIAVSFLDEARGQAVNGLRTDNALLSPLYVDSGGSATLSFDAINSGSSTPRINGIEVSVNNGAYQFVSIPFTLPPETRQHVTYTFSAPTVGCISSAQLYSVGFRLNYNDNRIQNGSTLGAFISVPTHASITRQPASRSTCSNSLASFSVSVSGTQVRTRWEWRRPGATAWTQMVEGYNVDGSSGMRAFFASGSTSTRVTLTTPADVTLIPSIELRATASNMCNSVQSDPAACTWNASVTLTEQPVSAESCHGAPATFTVNAAGAATLSFTWQVEDPAANWISLTPVALHLPGGGTAAATPLDSRSVEVDVRDRVGILRVRCVVSNDCGSLSSTAAVLTLCPIDLTCDGFVDFFDYDAFVNAFQEGAPEADFNQDGFLDFFDYDAFVDAFETGC